MLEMRWDQAGRTLLPLLFLSSVTAQLSAPVSHDDHVNIAGNKFLQNRATLDTPGALQEEALPFQTCPQNVQLRWMTEVSSSIYATPVITDLYSDGRKDIIVPSFVHYLEVLEADNGAEAVGWPAFHRSTVHASPLLYDIDLDGVHDILLATYNGEVMFFKDTGEQLPVGLSIPRLKVRKMWYKGLNPDPNIRDPNGLGGENQDGDSGVKTPFGTLNKLSSSNQQQRDRRLPPPIAISAPRPVTEQVAQQLKEYRRKMIEYRDKYSDAALRQLLRETRMVNPLFYGLLMKQLMEEGLLDQEGHVHLPKSSPPATSDLGAQPHRRLMQIAEVTEANRAAGVEEAPEGRLTEEAADSFDVFQEQGMQATDADIGPAPPGGYVVDQDEYQPLTDLPQLRDEVPANQTEAGQDGKRLQDTDGLGEFANMNILDGNDYRPLLDEANKKALGLTAEYDELGDRYDLVEKRDASELESETDERRLSRLADMNKMMLDIDTSSLEEDGLTSDKNHYQHLYAGDYAAIANARNDALSQWWQDEEFRQAAHVKAEEHIYVDAHVLATPNIADIDADGHDELVVPVSYFYDKEYYDQPAHKHELGEDVDTSKYIASGVVVFDLRTRSIKWSQHLDLSTDITAFKAYAYSIPTLADVNKDGLLEIVMGTSMGFLYVLDPKTGHPIPGWPIQMGEVQGQALVMDVNNDGHIEIVAADTRGNVAAFKASGEEVWSRHVKSLVAQGAVAGDVNGDGELEVVFGTSSGHIYVLSGSTGTDLKGFPFRTHGRVHAPILITRLVEGPSQHLVVTSFDGYLYLIDGVTACADTVDIGETSYSMVLADDLDGNGKLDLLVSTMNGNVYCFETPSAFHPLKTWTSQTLGPNGLVARHDLVGIYATKASRRPRDIAGERLRIQVSVVDKRAIFASNGSLLEHKSGPYNITAVLRGVGIKEMGMGPQPVIGVADTVANPGVYTLEIPCPRTRSTATVHLEMSDASGLVLSDDFALSFHMHFHKLLKWLIAAPVALMVAGLLAALKSLDDEDLEESNLSLPTTEQPHQA